MWRSAKTAKDKIFPHAVANAFKAEKFCASYKKNRTELARFQISVQNFQNGVSRRSAMISGG